MAGAPELYANGALNLAGNLIALGRLEEAAEQLAPIEHQFDEDPDPWMRWRWSVHLMHHRARLRLAQGDPEQALVWSERELADAESSGSRKLIARGHEQRGRILLTMDRRDDAEAELASAIAVAERIEYKATLWRARSLLSELARRRGDGAGRQREITTALQWIDRLAPGVPTGGPRDDFARLATRLAEDPLGTNR